ncbi:MAG: (2Fe-2S) ferredoxin domain-containing protein [Lentisphaerae bacterium]|nr:(2Fe-2S) ferredoxin domain-containing protein [Lentisphaerota bacterium]MCP4101796.1 (2Fe-2S) ferredoxin domain-containing protein [Lentisphaerota bacterium]
MTKKKVKVEICVGTTCFLLGASKLQEMERFLPPDLTGRVEVQGTACLGCCRNDNFGSAPFVKVDDTDVIANATLEKVINRVRRSLNL